VGLAGIQSRRIAGETGSTFADVANPYGLSNREVVYHSVKGLRQIYKRLYFNNFPATFDSSNVSEGQ
jgi:hypothetical protein